ncbi:MAG: OmpA family protein [Saprospiraceae bacterium]
MKLFYSVVFLFFSFLIYSQEVKLTPESFRVTGDAVRTGEHCYRLTKAMEWQGGTLWFKNPINLNDPFEMEIDLKFGCSDQGADGIVFIFHDKLRTGMPGEGMGFGRLKPSLGIEMDTYQNHHRDDPEFDHMAIMMNGNLNHGIGESKPIPILPNRRNIEDCKLHRVKVIWNPYAKEFQIFIDNNLRIIKQIDIVGKIFKGNPNVYWGFSAATGGSYNLQEICLEKMRFTEVANFDEKTKTQLLDGEIYSLKNVEFSTGKSTLKTNDLRELNRLVNLLKENKQMNIFIYGNTDSSGDARTNKIISQKRADEVAKYLLQNGIDKKRIKAKGYGESFPKENNGTVEGRKINRRVDVYLVKPRA